MTEQQLTLALMRTMNAHFQAAAETPETLATALRALANAVSSVLSLEAADESAAGLFQQTLDRHLGQIRSWKAAGRPQAS